MSITMMTDRKTAFAVKHGDERGTVRAVYDYPGAEVVHCHSWDCPHHDDPRLRGERGPECSEHLCRVRDPLYLHTTYRGCVLTTRERNGHEDSDFYAVVYDGREDCLKTIEYASTRGWTYPNGARADADVWTMLRARGVLFRNALAQMRERMLSEARRVAESIHVGVKVRVVRGRKPGERRPGRLRSRRVARGTEGEVAWLGPCRYSGRPRVGLRDEHGEWHFTALSNVERIDCEEVQEPDWREVHQAAAAWALRHNFAGGFSPDAVEAYCRVWMGV